MKSWICVSPQWWFCQKSIPEGSDNFLFGLKFGFAEVILLYALYENF